MAEAIGKSSDQADHEMLRCADWLDLSLNVLGSRPNARGGLTQSKPPNRKLSSDQNQKNLSREKLSDDLIQKLRNRLRNSALEEWDGRFDVGMSNSAVTEIRTSYRQSSIGKIKIRDNQLMHKTYQKVFDYRTFRDIEKMKSKPGFNEDFELNGTIATGKEANVYTTWRTIDEQIQELAVKVYKTTVLDFKDRTRYIQGDRRFGSGLFKHNPRKMVRSWSLKEYRNLQRMVTGGVRCPKPIMHLGNNILVMEFIGEQYRPAPRLKDASLSLNKLCKCYLELIKLMRDLYQKCNLVHGDLNEYNVLYFKGHLYIIDVSQSVDRYQDNAFVFLREDCLHVSVFFKKQGVSVMQIRELFDFIVDTSIVDEDSYLEEVQQKIFNREDMLTAREEIVDSVFMHAYIPRTLDGVCDAEGDVDRLASGQDTSDMYYQTVTGMKHLFSEQQPDSAESETNEMTVKVQMERQQEDKNEVSETDQLVVSELQVEEQQENRNVHEEEEEEEEGGQSDREKSETETNDAQLSRDDKKRARKEHKKVVKLEKREARKNKVKKADKKKNLKMIKILKQQK